VFSILMAWFEGELVFYLVYLYPFVFHFAFLSYSPKLTIASLVILASIWLIMLIIMVG
jgi:hypothetical protein